MDVIYYELSFCKRNSNESTHSRLPLPSPPLHTLPTPALSLVLIQPFHSGPVNSALEKGDAAFPIRLKKKIN